MKHTKVTEEELTGNNLKVKNLIDNFINDIETLKGKNALIGISIISDDSVLSQLNTTAYYLPAVLASFFIPLEGAQKTKQSTESLLERTVNTDVADLPIRVMTLYHTLKELENER